MDPLSDVLSLLKPRCPMVYGFDAAGAWSVYFARQDGIRCFASVQGEFWLVLEGRPGVRLGAGDCFLLPKGQPFRLASDPRLPPVDAEAIFAATSEGGVATYNGGGDCFGVGGYFSLSSNHAHILLDVLPTVVHIRNESDKAALRWSMERLMQEFREPQPGSSLLIGYLVNMVLVQALRSHLTSRSNRSIGWLSALADDQIGAAINAMHKDPANSWSLQSLAKCAALSRSSFAVRFREAVGLTPMEYLSRWRMLVAEERLRHSKSSIAQVAHAVGYRSEAAFSTAFKRINGCSPRRYSRQRDRPDSQRVELDRGLCD